MVASASWMESVKKYLSIASKIYPKYDVGVQCFALTTYIVRVVNRFCLLVLLKNWKSYYLNWPSKVKNCKSIDFSSASSTVKLFVINTNGTR